MSVVLMMDSQAGEKPTRPPQVAVIVLGDVGRSPRMQYHVRSLLAEGAKVDLIGEIGTPLLPDLMARPDVTSHLLPPGRAAHEYRGIGFTFATAVRVLRQSLRLVYLALVCLPSPDVILVQNPPAIPTLPIAVLAARLRRCRLVIDWHNLGHTMVAAQAGGDHWMTKLTAACERRLAPKADGHFCVSRAMQEALRKAWGIEAMLLYDEPAEQFHPISDPMRAQVLAQLLEGDLFPPPERKEPRRPAVIVTSTSWTPDEDFDLLLAAAVQMDRLLDTPAGRKELPDLLILITGEGRLRADFERRLASLRLRRVHLRTLWLDASQYPRLLAAADLGLSLHRSTSGIDLPMKVADMLGSGLPVCALDYGPCLAERIEHQRNGLLFRTAEELAEQWVELFRGFPQPSPLLAQLRRGVEASCTRRWKENWKQHAAPVFFPQQR